MRIDWQEKQRWTARQWASRLTILLPHTLRLHQKPAHGCTNRARQSPLKLLWHGSRRPQGRSCAVEQNSWGVSIGKKKSEQFKFSSRVALYLRAYREILGTSATPWRMIKPHFRVGAYHEQPQSCAITLLFNVHLDGSPLVRWGGLCWNLLPSLPQMKWKMGLKIRNKSAFLSAKNVFSSLKMSRSTVPRSCSASTCWATLANPVQTCQRGRLWQ